MLKYFIDNKEWIFSGIGIFLLAGGISLLKYFLDKRRDKEKFRTTTKFSDITVKKIFDEIQSTPPFQQDAASKHYNGIRVRWEGRLLSVERDKYLDKNEHIVRVIFYPIRENPGYGVVF
jgi:hypothetical protein